MPVKREGNITKRLQRSVRGMDAVIVRTLQYGGEKGTNDARDNHNYTDQTGNLTSSMGYCVSNDGRIEYTSAFEPVKNGSEGSGKGRSFAQEVASQLTGGKSLVMVAGMEYAGHLTDKGYVVMDSGFDVANDYVSRTLKKLKLTD